MRLYVLSIVVPSFCFCAWAAAIEPLPDTAPLDWPEEDLSGRMMDGAHRFVERAIDNAVRERGQFWKFNATSLNSYYKTIDPNREYFREIIGAVNPRVPVRMERYGDDENAALVGETPIYQIFQVRWNVLDGVDGEGLLVEPKNAPASSVVAIPDADQTPEQVLGLAPGVPVEQQFARRLAESGCRVVVPVLVDRRPYATNDEQIKRSQQTNREWLYRQAFHMGRHPIGYEVQKIQAAVDWLSGDDPLAKTLRNDRRPIRFANIGVVGYGEGGQLALYTAVVRSSVHATLVSGYFDSRDRLWAEPIYRNVWDFTKRFSDAELASYLWPRKLVVEYAPVPTIAGHKGDWQTPEYKSVVAELIRIAHPIPERGSLTLIAGESGKPTGPLSDKALQEFASHLNLRLSSPQPPANDMRKTFDPAERQQRTVKQIERHIQSLVRSSEHTRDKFFLYKMLPELENKPWSTDKALPTQTAEKFIAAAKPLREKFQREAMGKFDVEYLPLNPRSRKVVETDKWTAWDVVLDVWPDVFAWGLLVVPKDIKGGERRPVVVCQHGRNGVPRDCLDRHSTAYNDFAAKLAERGFITFAPHNLYRGEDRYRWLNRKANTIGCTLFSFIIGQHERILDWLGTLPYVDADRIAFYGLSYGGETAVRVPTVLDKYCLSICSGDFNQWTTKVAATDQPFSFMRTIEWEMPYWNLGQTFDYAEMAYLMVPRPFMVERGHLDRVGRDPWVAHEYAKVRFLYAQLGLADKAEIEYFQGGHSINGQGTFSFLHKHLQWPAPEER
jgi:dienelactone hydrolase